MTLVVCADGQPWTLRLTTHVLIAGASEAGKGWVVWALTVPSVSADGPDGLTVAVAPDQLSTLVGGK